MTNGLVYGGHYRIHFFSRSGKRYEIDSYYINPLYFEQSDSARNGERIFKYKQGDIAILLINNQTFSTSYKTQFLNSLSSGCAIRMHAYTVQKQGEKYERTEHQIEDSASTITSIYTSFDAQTHEGMSGANTFVFKNNICSLVSVHTLGSDIILFFKKLYASLEDESSIGGALSNVWQQCTKRNLSLGITLYDEKIVGLHTWHHNLLKKNIWGKMIDSEQSREENTVKKEDIGGRWYPVLFSIHTDNSTIEGNFLKLLDKALQKRITENAININDLFHFFALSGTAEKLTKDNFLNAIINDQNSINDPSNFEESEDLLPKPICRDVTVDGLDKLLEQYPDDPSLVFSLGIGRDSMMVYQKMEKRKLFGHLCEYIDYFSELKEQSIKKTADRIANLLVQNYINGLKDPKSPHAVAELLSDKAQESTITSSSQDN